MEKSKNCSFPITREIQIENFPNSLTHGEYVYYTIGHLFGDEFKCCLKVTIEDDEGEEFLTYKLFIRKRRRSFIKLEVTFNFYVVNHNETEIKVYKRTVQPDGMVFIRKQMKMENILTPNRGWLKNGVFTIRVAMSADTYFAGNQNRSFNFSLPFYNRDHCAKVNFKEWPEHNYYFHNQILSLHAPKLLDPNFHREIIGPFGDFISVFAQMHGSRIRWDEGKKPTKRSISFKGEILKNLVVLAHLNKINNVVRKIEQHMIQTYGLYYRKYWHWAYEIALECNMRSFLKELLKDVHCRKQLGNIIQKNNIERMSGEALKQFTAKIFTFARNYRFLK